MVEWTDKRVSIAIFSRGNRRLGFEHGIDTTDCQAYHMLAWRALEMFCPALGRNGRRGRMRPMAREGQNATHLDELLP